MTPTPPDAAPRNALKRARRLVDAPALATQAVTLLCSSEALFTMSIDDARCIVGYMSLLSYAKGATLLREGDPRDGSPGPDANELLLILEGQVSVDLGLESRSGGVAIASLGPGSFLGEVSALDGLPRSAQCTAISPVHAARLSQKSLQAMLDAHPREASKLMAALARCIAERLRATGQQLQAYDHLAGSLQAEVDQLRAAARR
ncbi:MAG: cyclic nucleotide-binding domain-containing protein [Burkholderiaceae bacterium]